MKKSKIFVDFLTHLYYTIIKKKKKIFCRLLNTFVLN
nr:MAG TPA: Protein of unknown function (DUF565) [Caudoviricetes sp.]